MATLIRLLAEDEERHHRLFEEIGKTLRDRLDWNEDAPALNDSSRMLQKLKPSGCEGCASLKRMSVAERGLRELAHRARAECSRWPASSWSLWPWTVTNMHDC